MSVSIGVLKETPSGERRVALVPGDLKAIRALGAEVTVETGAGAASAYPDSAYEAAGATIAKSRADVLAASRIVLFVEEGAGDWHARKLKRAMEARGVAVVGQTVPRRLGGE